MSNIESDDPVFYQKNLLDIYRRNLRNFMLQRAQHGLVPPLHLINSINNEKNNILSVKKTLFSMGVIVEDVPDEPSLNNSESKKYSNIQNKKVMYNSSISDDSRAVSAGFNALRELMQLKEVREEVGVFRDNLRSSRRCIMLIGLYKKIHDHFQELESCYNTLYHFIYHNNQLVSIETSLWEGLEKSEPNLQRYIEVLLDCAVSPELASEQGAWQQQLKRASDELQMAIAHSDEMLLKRATKSIRDIIGTQPSRVNDRMCVLIRSLRDLNMGAKLRNLRDRLLQLNLDLAERRLVMRFEEGISALIRLGEQIDYTMNTHNDFQEIDNQLRLIETRIEQDISELAYAWIDLNVFSRSLCSKNREQWSRNLYQLTLQLDRALELNVSNDIIRCFRKYRSQASRGFNEIDGVLLRQCNDLIDIGGSIDPIFEIL